MPETLLFLSHAGVDSAAALALAERIERGGVKVWIDKRDLVAGRGWQQQLEGIIDRESTAFAVYVGSRGVVNWVENEVRAGLSRATRDAKYPFIPILARGVDSGALPSFARQFQGVRDVENDPEALQQLLRAARGETGRAKIALESQPFLGLSAFDEAHTHLFFGRERETAELVERLRATNLLMVVGDSGSGKSSLVKAGLIPRFRGGAFAPAQSDRPDETPWHVVQMRPQTVPFERLVEAASVAARTAGVDVETRLALGKAIRTRDADTIRDALREGAPAHAHTLLVVDQFEELWTQAPASDRAAFIDALLGLTRPGDFVFRVVVTMRRDYYNLCSQHPEFFARVNARDALERYQVRRMSDAALRDCIVKPLALTDAGRVDVFADAVLADVGDQPGELALLEMALTEAWRRRGESGGNLLEAYERAGRVSGALANAAEEVFTEQLSDSERALAEPLFIRLVRLGDTGGTTRRIVARSELHDDAWALAQRLADESHKRLLLVTADTAELAHEALVTQWPRYQNWLQPAAADKRRLDALMDDAARWAAAEEADRHKFVARGFDLDNYVQLARNDARAAWLSETETAFVQASVDAAERQERQFADLYRKALGRQLASQAMRLLDEPRCRELETAVLLAVEAHRRHPSLEAQQALFCGVERLPRLLVRIAVPGRRDRTVVASPAGRYLAVGDGRSGFTIYDMQQARPACHPAFDGGTAAGCVFSQDERYFAAVGRRSRVRVWATDTGDPIGEFNAGPDRLGPLRFSPGADLLAVMDAYGHRVRILRVETLALVADLPMGVSKWPDMAFSPDGAHFAALDETTATVWETAGWQLKHEFRTSGRRWLFFSRDAESLITLGDAEVQGWTMLDGELSFEAKWPAPVSHGRPGPGPDGITVATRFGQVRICSIRPFAERQRLEGHDGLFELCFDPLERRAAAFEHPDIVRVWDIEAGVEVERYLIDGEIRSASPHFDGQGLGFTTGEESTDGLTVSRYLCVPGPRRFRVESPERFLGRVEVSADGASIAYVAEGLHVLSAESGTLQRHLAGDFGRLAFDPRGVFLGAVRSSIFDSGVTLVSLRDDGRCDLPSEGTTSYSHVRWSPGGEYFGVTCVPKTVTIWRRELHRRIDLVHADFPRKFEFLPGGRLVATLDDGRSVRIWDIEEACEIASHEIEGTFAGHLSCHPHEPIVAASGANARNVTIWDYANDRVLATCSHRGSVNTHAISPCGRWLATMDDNAALLWRLPDGAPAHRLPHFDRINACAFSTDGSWLATACADRTVRVWDTSTGAQVAHINRHQAVQWAGFVLGDALLVVRHGRTVEVLAWRPADLIEIAGQRLRRNLSPAEWRTYMEDESYRKTFSDLPSCDGRAPTRRTFRTK